MLSLHFATTICFPLPLPIIRTVGASRVILETAKHIYLCMLKPHTKRLC